MNITSTTFEIELETGNSHNKETLVIPVGDDGLSKIGNEPRPENGRTFYDISRGDTVLDMGVPRKILSIKILEQNGKGRC